MTRLADALDDAIEKLEILVDSQKPAPKKAVSSLKKLYSQRRDLIESSINNATEEYRQATLALKEAAVQTQKAINDLAKLEDAIEKIGSAIAKIGALILAVA